MKKLKYLCIAFFSATIAEIIAGVAGILVFKPDMNEDTLVTALIFIIALFIFNIPGSIMTAYHYAKRVK